MDLSYGQRRDFSSILWELSQDAEGGAEQAGERGSWSCSTGQFRNRISGRKIEVRGSWEREKVSGRNENVGKEVLLFFYALYNDTRALDRSRYLASEKMDIAVAPRGLNIWGLKM